MKTNKLLMRTFLTVCVLLLVSAAAFAQTKTVTPSPTPQSVAAGANFNFDVNYTSTDNTTTGIGFKMCFDSTKVAFVNRTNILATGDQGASVAADALDADSNPATDQCLANLWLDLGGNWPNVSLPVRLYTANLTAAAGFNAGSTTITFVSTSCGAGFTCSYTSEVINAIPPTAVATLTPNPAATQAGGNATMTVTLNQAAGAGGQLVNLSSGNNALVTVPVSVTVPAGQLSTTFAAHGVAVGSTTVSAQVGATPAVNATVNVTAATITLTPATANVANGGTVQMTVSITPAQAATVTLASAGGHTTVPANVAVPAGGTATFNVTGTSVGGPDTITATLPVALGGGTDTSQVTVQAVTLTITPTPTATAVVGAPITYTACINPAPVAATVVTIPVDPDFTFSATSVTIPAGSTCAPTFTARPNAVSAAATSFTVTAPGGLTGTATVNAVTAITCTLTDAGNGVLLTVSQAQPGALSVGVTSSNTAALTVPATFNLPANATSVTIPYTVIAAGTSTVTTTLPATVGSGICRVNATVNPVPVPAVDGLGLALLAGLLALAGLYFVRK